MKSFVAFLMSFSLISPAYATSRRPVANDFGRRLVAARVVPQRLEKPLKELIQRMALDQPRLTQVFPLQTTSRPDESPSLDEKTRQLAVQFADAVGAAQYAFAKRDPERVKLQVTRALEIMAEAYALSSANGGNHLQLGMWRSHLNGAGSGALFLALLYQLNSLRQNEMIDNFGNGIAAILVVLLGGNLWNARGQGLRLSELATRSTLVGAVLPTFHRAQVARANVEYFWREVLAIVDQEDSFETADAILAFMSAITPDRSLETACEALVLEGPRTANFPSVTKQP